MTAKEYLSQVRKVDIEIQQQKETLEMLMVSATSITSTINPVKVQSGSKRDKIGDSVAKMVDLEDEIQNKMADAFYRKHEIINQIHGLDNALYISVLFKRYFQGKNLNGVAEEIGMSYQYTVEVHGKALKAFEKRYADILKGGEA